MSLYRRRLAILGTLITVLGCAFAGGAGQKNLKPEFHTSERCLACHNGLTNARGEDVSIGFKWRASIMANSARDPYFQASTRREDIEHPTAKAEIEDGCADCHMPIARYEAKVKGQLGQVFAHLPFDEDPKKNPSAEDGVSCSICHQIESKNLGTPQSFSGRFEVAAPESKDNRPEYGPFSIKNGQQHIMQTSTGGFRPTEAAHIRDAALCATCHTLYTKSLSPEGKELGSFPEQVPFLEWQHSDYVGKQTCQACHMPEFGMDVPIAAVLGEFRPGVRQHTFVGANFFALALFNRHRDELSVKAMPVELTEEAARTRNFLQSQAARVSIRNVQEISGRLQIAVQVENLSGHKLPTAFPSRRAWLHLWVQDGDGKEIFESGALKPDGSIEGNDNDADPARFEPHYREITKRDQVQIYESILKDSQDHVTTGLAAAVGYLKDNRLLPSGFDKQTAGKDIAAVGEASADPDFNASGNMAHYSISTSSRGPYKIYVELWYQPIGYRWAHNLAPYDSAETKRFVQYYDSESSNTAIILAHAESTN